MKEFESDCIISTDSPRRFAEELGDVVGSQANWENVDRSPAEMFVHEYLVSQDFEKVVHVYHGPVLYTDESIGLIDSIDTMYKAVAACFVKRLEFSWQQEYRFVVSIQGSPRTDVFLPRASDALKALGRRIQTE